MKNEFTAGLVLAIIVLVAVIVCFVISVAGCTAPGHYEQLTDTVNKSIDVQQKSAAEIVEAVRESGLISEQKMAAIAEKVAAGNADIDTIQKALIAGAKELDEQDKDRIQAWIDALEAANKQSIPVNPYAGLIAGVLGIAVAVKKAFDANRSDTAVREIVSGIEAYKKRASSAEVLSLKDSLRTSTVTSKVIIAKAKNGQK